MDINKLEELLKKYDRIKNSHISKIIALAIFGMCTQTALAVILVLFLRK